MAGNKIHQTEIERLDAGQCSDFPDLMQRAQGFDQNVYRDFSFKPKFGFDAAQIVDLGTYVLDATWLWQRDKR